MLDYKFPETDLIGFAFDIESTPNFFSVIFIDLQQDRTLTFFEFENISNRNMLKSFMRKEMRKGRLNLYGYNSKSYDMPMLSAYLLGAIPQELYYLSQSIIGHQRGGPVSEIIFDYASSEEKTIYIKKPNIMGERWWNPPYNLMDISGIKNHDLQLVMSIDVDSVNAASLKHVAIRMGWPWIKELPFKYDHIVKNLEEVKLFLEYNKNDVGITKLLAITKAKKEIKTRYSVERRMGLEDAVNFNRSRLANRLLQKMLPGELGMEYSDIKEGRTYRDSVLLGDCISDKVRFKTPYFSNLLAKLKSETIDTRPVDEDGKKVKISLPAYLSDVLFDDVPYTMGVGGLHSDDGKKPCVIVPKRGEILIDGDVASFYPAIMINNRIFPEHLGERFLDVFTTYTLRRLEAKELDPALADTLKIVINSIFGKQGNQYHWLYDPKAFLSVTLNGQLALFMWIEMLVEAGHTVFSANTDGVTAKVNDTNSYVQVCEEWMDVLNYKLEFARYAKVARRDVNNYLAIIEADGKIKNNNLVWEEKDEPYIKQKGSYEEGSDLGKAAKPPILAHALNRFFVDGTPVETTVDSVNNIYSYCMSQRVGSSFRLFFSPYNGKRIGLQRTSRWIYGSGPTVGDIVKINNNGSETISTFPAIVTNDLRGLEQTYMRVVDKSAYVNLIKREANKANYVEQEALF